MWQHEWLKGNCLSFIRHELRELDPIDFAIEILKGKKGSRLAVSRLNVLERRTRHELKKSGEMINKVVPDQQH